MKLHGHNWVHIKTPKGVSYNATIQTDDSDFVRKLTSTGGPKTVRVKGKIDHFGEGQITLRNCVDLSDY